MNINPKFIMEQNAKGVFDARHIERAYEYEQKRKARLKAIRDERNRNRFDVIDSTREEERQESAKKK